jgi:hypothetical protein
MNLYSGDFDVSGVTTGFKIQSFSLNPANINLFPILNRIALNYQEYNMKGMWVIFKSLASNTSTALALGSVFMSADYNVLATLPTSKLQIENMDFSGSSKTSNSFGMPIECARFRDTLNHLYVNANSSVTGGDPRMSDLCLIHIASEGAPAENTIIGEIHVAYDVELFKTRLPDGAAPSTYFLQSCQNYTAGGNPLGSTTGSALIVNPPGNDSNIVVDRSNTNSYGKPSITIGPTSGAQAYLLYISWGGTTAAAITYPTIAGLGGVVFSTVSSNIQTPGAGVTSAAASVLYLFQTVPNQTGVITVALNGTLPSVGNTCDLFLFPFSNDLWEFLNPATLVSQPLLNQQLSSFKKDAELEIETLKSQMEKLMNMFGLGSPAAGYGICGPSDNSSETCTISTTCSVSDTPRTELTHYSQLKPRVAPVRLPAQAAVVKEAETCDDEDCASVWTENINSCASAGRVTSRGATYLARCGAWHPIGTFCTKCIIFGYSPPSDSTPVPPTEGTDEP